MTNNLRDEIARREIAKDYPQMDYSNVWRIAAGISWRHVQPEGAGT